VQIAGLVARRIICKLTAGQAVKAGDLYGLIRFGSRVDIYLPPGVAPMVCVGQRAIGGETVIADFKSSETARMGEIRS
jgi:phosphatidylserine decarboxylase